MTGIIIRNQRRQDSYCPICDGGAGDDTEGKNHSESCIDQAMKREAEKQEEYFNDEKLGRTYFEKSNMFVYDEWFWWDKVKDDDDSVSSHYSTYDVEPITNYFFDGAGTKHIYMEFNEKE